MSFEITDLLDVLIKVHWCSAVKMSPIRRGRLLGLRYCTLQISQYPGPAEPEWARAVIDTALPDHSSVVILQYNVSFRAYWGLLSLILLLLRWMTFNWVNPGKRHPHEKQNVQFLCSLKCQNMQLRNLIIYTDVISICRRCWKKRPAKISFEWVPVT